uniref:Reverse gyrase zinc finger n=1 Tax=Siphoviridae sp. ctXX925 TaxID=2826370 RepID=A0A8S5R1D1_9CAUD|nr:MAG TPA: Reverse gyrase zinc finger [Siphoviridae sp. ctXX925]
MEKSSGFQRHTTFATLVPIIPKFKGICPNC